jgi:hypothetical protein
MNEPKGTVYRIATKREDQAILASVQFYKGRRVLHLRQFYEKDGEWKPTQRGITLPAEEIGELEAAVSALKAGIVEKKAA